MLFSLLCPFGIERGQAPRNPKSPPLVIALKDILTPRVGHDLYHGWAHAHVEVFHDDRLAQVHRLRRPIARRLLLLRDAANHGNITNILRMVLQPCPAPRH